MAIVFDRADPARRVDAHIYKKHLIADWTTGPVAGVAAPPANTAPAQFAAGGWAVTDLATAGDIRIAVNTLPSDGGSAITALQYDINSSGSWIALTGVGTGNRDIAGFTDGVSVDIRLRAVNAVGNGAASAVKAVTPTTGATAPAQFGTGEWAVTDLATSGDIRIAVNVLPSDGGSAITALQYDVNSSGSWIALTGVGTGNRDLSGFTDGVSVNIRLRAVNAIGNGTASAVKAVTPTAPALSPFLLDNFDGANNTQLTAHTPDVGGAWVNHPSFGNINRSTLNGAGSLQITDALGGTVGLYNATVPPTPDYYVECIFGFTTVNLDSYPGITGRMQTGADTMYYARYASGGGGNVWQLFRAVTGTYTVIGTSVNQAYPTSTDVTVRLVMDGDQISLQRNGVTIIGPVTDTGVTTAGRAGIRWNGNPSSILKRNFIAQEIP